MDITLLMLLLQWTFQIFAEKNLNQSVFKGLKYTPEFHPRCMSCSVSSDVTTIDYSAICIAANGAHWIDCPYECYASIHKYWDPIRRINRVDISRKCTKLSEVDKLNMYDLVHYGRHEYMYCMQKIGVASVICSYSCPTGISNICNDLPFESKHISNMRIITPDYFDVIMEMHVKKIRCMSCQWNGSNEDRLFTNDSCLNGNSLNKNIVYCIDKNHACLTEVSITSLQSSLKLRLNRMCTSDMMTNGYEKSEYMIKHNRYCQLSNKACNDDSAPFSKILHFYTNEVIFQKYISENKEVDTTKKPATTTSSEVFIRRRARVKPRKPIVVDKKNMQGFKKIMGIMLVILVLITLMAYFLVSSGDLKSKKKKRVQNKPTKK